LTAAEVRECGKRETGSVALGSREKVTQLWL
jgi:hypothetical protein